jgi:NADH-quinone oxidoreductase subunit G
MKNERFAIEIDGKEILAEPGEMLIQTADRAGIYIPRFCYHKKLQIAANCRMCLVEVENAPKTLPACATPVAPGMKAFTRSKKTIESQKAVMEFLLANHPLDCPICDQGGECELQDLSVGYGTDSSRFGQSKRVVADENLGPLVATEMTRCIHCTRCVRFCQDIAGVQEMGAFNRGGEMNIGTFLVNGLHNELSGNVIDLCPVGALTSKPFRYQGRSWEFEQFSAVSPHDCIGSNLYYHAYAKHNDNSAEVMRVLPKENEAINEVWLSDRDRFSYTGLASSERAHHPMIKQDGQWKQVSWETALNAVASHFKAIMQAGQAQEIGGLISGSASCEEQFLFQKLLRSIGSPHVDYRVHMNDFSDQMQFTSYPGMAGTLADIANAATILVVGGNIREDQPILCHRIRQAVKSGSKLLMINPYDYDLACPIQAKKVLRLDDMLPYLVALNTVINPATAHGEIADRFLNDQALNDIASALQSASGSVAIIAGEHIESALDGAQLRAWLQQLSLTVGGHFHQVTRGANAAGAWLTGAIPHRGECLVPADRVGYHAKQMIEAKLPVYVLHGVEVEHDCIDPQLAIEALREADLVISCQSYVSETTRALADIILPIAAFSEYAGSMVNACGQHQTFHAAVLPPAEAKPAWKVYRVLGSLLGIEALQYNHCSEITRILADTLPSIQAHYAGQARAPQYLNPAKAYRVGHWPAYRLDAIVRRAAPLQAAIPVDVSHARLHPDYAAAHGIEDGQPCQVTQGIYKETVICQFDPRLPYGSIWLAAAINQQATLANVYGEISIVGVRT